MSRHPIDAPVQGGEEDSTSSHVVAALMGVTAQVKHYQEMGHLPEDPFAARVLAANKSQYTLIEGNLYHTPTDCSLQIVPPQVDRRALFEEVHAGKFGGHLGDAKVFSSLNRHYWWPCMRSDIAGWYKACLVCAKCQVGCAPKPYLTSIPVGGPFNCIGVDVLQLHKLSKGNQYAIVFIDYLTDYMPMTPIGIIKIGSKKSHIRISAKEASIDSKDLTRLVDYSSIIELLPSNRMIVSRKRTKDFNRKQESYSLTKHAKLLQKFRCKICHLFLFVRLTLLCGIDIRNPFSSFGYVIDCIQAKM